MQKPIYDKWIIIWYEDDSLEQEIIEEVADWVKEWESEAEIIEEVKEEVAEEVTEAPNETAEVEVEVVENIPTVDEYEATTTQSSEWEVTEELNNLDELLKETLEISENSDTKETEEMQKKLDESIKIINKLKKRNSELEISIAEREWLWDNYWLSPSLVIIKTNYDKAIQWDENALSKIKQILLSDLGLEFKNNKETVFGYDIYASNDYSVDTNDNWLWFRTWIPV